MLSSRQKIATIEVTPTSRPISLGTKPGELCGNPKLNPNTMCLKLSDHFQNDCHSSLFHAPKPRWIKNTHQATFALCVSSKALPQWRWNLQAKCSEWFTLPWRQWWIFQLPALSFSCVPALSALSENSPKPHSSHRFKLFPPRFSPPPLLSTPSFSPYSASPSNVTGRLPPSPVFCHVLLPLYPSPSPHPELAACFPSISPLCGIILWMCVKKGAQTFFFGWVSEWGVGGVWEGVECSFAF